MHSTPSTLAFLPRHLASALAAAIADTPVVCLLGPRQCGKSTLARLCDPQRAYVSLDDQVYFDLARRDPQGFVDNLPDRVAIDEVQRAPELALAIKRSVDARRSPGRFLLTGSANLLQLPRLADSLAGRMECLYLHPFSGAELERRPGRFLASLLDATLRPDTVHSPLPTSSTLPQRLVTGGFPEPNLREQTRAERWKSSYLQAVVERDIRDIADVRDASNLHRLLRFLAQRNAQLINHSAIANALGHSRASIERYMTLLERLFLIRQLPAWHTNRGKRLVKSPKLHFVDSGLAATLGELSGADWNAQRMRYGQLLESFVLQQLVAMGDCLPRPPRFYHYRDKDAVEVDIVMEHGDSIWGIEVKAAASVNEADARGLLKLATAAGPQFRAGLVMYDGTAFFQLHKDPCIVAVPLARLWES